MSGRIDKAKVAEQFGRWAGSYDRCCRIQKAMALGVADAAAGIGLAASPAILELGCGTGSLTGLLARRFPDAAITAIDLASAMLGRAAENLGTNPRVRFTAADAESAAWAPESFDLVCSSAALQWFEDPFRALGGLSAALRPAGVMLHATFGPATFVELFEILSEVRRGAAGGLGPPAAASWRRGLAEAGLEPMWAESDTATWNYPDATAFLAELKSTGAAYSPSAGSGWAGYRLLREAVTRYDRRYRGPAGVPVTYELIQFCCRKAPVLQRLVPAGASL